MSDINNPSTTNSYTFANFPSASSVAPGTQYYATDIGGGTLYISNGTNWEPAVTQSPYYYFHGFAGNQISGDTTFYDISGAGNNALKQTNNAALFTTAGYASTSASLLGGYAIPSLNFSYNGGQKLIFWCLQKTAALGSGNVTWGGDGYGTAHPGIRIRNNYNGGTNGFDFSLTSSTVTGFSSVSNVNPFDGNLHSFGFVIDGAGLQYQLWVDEVADTALGSGTSYTAFDGSAVINDTTNSNTFGLGGNSNATGSDYDATNIRAIAIFRLSSTKATPSVAKVTSLFQELRANPGVPLTNSAF